MNTLFDQSPLQQVFTALRNDLITPEGPRISTMRNHRFAIVQYAPNQEYPLRNEVRKLSLELTANGWIIIPLNLQKILLERVQNQPDGWTERVIQMEQRMTQIEPARGLNYLKSRLEPLIEGPDGIAADCIRILSEHAQKHPDHADRMLAIIGRTGALYPFFRSSALLKHIDGHTGNIPVLLLYPGSRVGQTGLSFMNRLNPDHDYRPRIYS